MSSPLEIIENYFSGNLSKEARQAFELKCESDPVFAEEVSFYITTRDSLKKELVEQKKKEFENLYKELKNSEENAFKLLSIPPVYWMTAAACLLLFFSWWLFFNNSSAQKLASAYIKKDLKTLSVTMGDSQNQLQIGLEAYNGNEYEKAEKIFLPLTDQKEIQAEALKYLGLTYLMEGKYEEAVRVFDRLSSFTNLYANSGPFYKAISLMKRSEKHDVVQAKEILEDIIEQDLPGKKQAEEWVKKMDD